jgi:acyl carrier protein
VGLDVVELVMEVEETFAFSICDEDAEKLDTVGKLYDCIMANRFQGREQGCLSNVAFYKLRRALMSVLKSSRDDIRLLSALNKLIPTDRRRTWAELQWSLKLRLPDLARPLWVAILGTALGIITTVVAFVYLVAGIGVSLAIISAIFVAFVIYGILYLATKPLAREFRPEFATVGGLTKAVLRLNYGAISDEAQRANAGDVWNTLRAIIVEQLGVRPDDVTKEANFVTDLRAD